MNGRGLELVTSARATFDAGLGELTFTLPAAAKKGDLLLALVAADGSSVAPAGWTQIETALGAGSIRLDVYARMVDDDEPAAATFEAASAFVEYQGLLLLFASGVPALVREASGHGTFAASVAPATPGASSVQATNLLVTVHAAVGGVAFTAPSGFTAIDTFDTTVAVQQSILFAYRRAGATDALVLPAAAAAPAATGGAWTLVLRDRAPIVPAELLDPVPGNIGLLPT